MSNRAETGRFSGAVNRRIQSRFGGAVTDWSLQGGRYRGIAR